MRTKVPMPANSSSPASVEPGSRPLAAQAAAQPVVLRRHGVGDHLVQQIGPGRGVGRGPRGGVIGHLVDDASSAAVSTARRPRRGAALVGVITGRGHRSPARDGHVGLRPALHAAPAGSDCRSGLSTAYRGAPPRRRPGLDRSASLRPSAVHDPRIRRPAVALPRPAGRCDRGRRGRAPAGTRSPRRSRRTDRSRSTTSSGVPATPWARSSSALRPMRRRGAPLRFRRRRSTRSGPPTAAACPGRDPGTTGGAHPVVLGVVSATEEKGRLNSARVGGGEARRADGPATADDQRRVGPLDRLGQGRAVPHVVVAPVEAEGLAHRRGPEPGEDGVLLLQALEALRPAAGTGSP